MMLNSLNHRRTMRPRTRLMLERLEDRLTPAIHWTTIANALDGPLDKLSLGIAAIDNANALPVVNQPLSGIPLATDIVNSFRTQLHDSIALTDMNNLPVEQNITAALGS